MSKSVKKPPDYEQQFIGDAHEDREGKRIAGFILVLCMVGMLIVGALVLL